MKSAPEVSASSSAPVSAMPNNSTSSAPMEKKSNAGKIIAIVVGVLVLLALCCAGALYLTGKAAENALAKTAAELQSSLPYALSSSLPSYTGSGSGSGSGTTVSTAAVGQRQTAGDFAYTVNSVQKDGNNYIMDITVENTLSKDATFSTLLQMELTGDADNTYSQNFMYDVGKDRLDGTVPAKGSVTGKIVYAVDDSPSKLTLTISGGFLSKSLATFSIK